MPIKSVLFDLDGTLIDQFEAIHRAFSRVLVDMGFPKPSFEKVKRAVGGASDTTMAKLIGSEHAPEGVRRLRPIFEEEMLNGLRPLPGAMETLRFCFDNGIPAAVLTNKHGPHARVVCEHLNFTKYLSFIIGANDTNWKKPNPKLTNFALEKLKAVPQESLYVGDSPYDFETSSQVGMPCVLVATGTHTETELKDLKGATVYQNLNVFLEERLKA
jgi:phosphoglycolate phosphatase-like HAD superfamily hydrolase